MPPDPTDPANPQAPVVPDPALASQFKELSERVAKTADADLKLFLAGILKASEATMADLKAMRDRLDKAQADADAAAVAAVKAKTEAAEAVTKSTIKAAAQKAGAVEAADVLPFIKLADVRVGEDGESNVAELVDALKKAKPHLFTSASTSTAAPAPKPGQTTAKSALEMTDAEWKAAKAK